MSHFFILVLILFSTHIIRDDDNKNWDKKSNRTKTFLSKKVTGHSVKKMPRNSIKIKKFYGKLKLNKPFKN